LCLCELRYLAQVQNGHGVIGCRQLRDAVSGGGDFGFTGFYGSHWFVDVGLT
jgi:hypothetical protein